MRIGNLRNRVTLQRPSPTQDAAGHESIDWTQSPITVWGSIKPIRGAEQIDADAARSGLLTSIVIRYSTDVSAVSNAWRVLDDSSPVVVYDVQAVRNLDRSDQWLELICTTGVNNG